MTTEEEYPEPISLRQHPDLVRGFKRLEESKKFLVDMSLMDEITGYVSVAKERGEKATKMRLPSRYKTEDDLHDLAAFIKETQANRDRVIEIKLGFLPLQRMLNQLWEEFLGLIYSYPCISKCTPAPARDAAINRVLAPLRDRMSMVDMIIAAASECDRNLGNAYFTIKELKAIGMIYIEAKRAQRGV